ncbi:MAG: glycosyltransferase [Desulfovibrio sp.]|nr:MAG: glycosyltransferase [Desulfovibrio sp.]
MLSVIIPVFNEEENLPLLHEKLLATLNTLGRDYEIIFINDGSSDDSAEVIDKLALGHGPTKGVHFRRNLGQTAAMMAGFDFASGEVIVPMDADLQNDPIDVPRLLEVLDQGYDVVSGWRKKRKDSFIRTFPSRVANRLISRISGVRLNDYGCSLKAYRKEVMEGVRLYGEMHRFIPIHASWQGAKVTEIPVTHHPRHKGVSKYGMGRILKVLLDLMVVKFLASYSQKPMYVFGGFGLVCLLLSFLTFGIMLYLRFFVSITFIETPLPTVVAIFFLTGFMCFLMGFLAEIMVRTYHESQGKPTYIVDRTVNFPDP